MVPLAQETTVVGPGYVGPSLLDQCNRDGVGPESEGYLTVADLPMQFESQTNRSSLLALSEGSTHRA